MAPPPACLTTPETDADDWANEGALQNSSAARAHHDTTHTRLLSKGPSPLTMPGAILLPALGADVTRAVTKRHMLSSNSAHACAGYPHGGRRNSDPGRCRFGFECVQLFLQPLVAL